MSSLSDANDVQNVIEDLASSMLNFEVNHQDLFHSNGILRIGRIDSTSVSEGGVSVFSDIGSSFEKTIFDGNKISKIVLNDSQDMGDFGPRKSDVVILSDDFIEESLQIESVDVSSDGSIDSINVFGSILDDPYGSPSISVIRNESQEVSPHVLLCTAGEYADETRSDIIRVSNPNAVSIVFLMKSVGFGGNFSGTPLWNLTDNPFVPQPLKDAWEPYLNRQYSGGVTFWDILTAPRANGTENPEVERFLLNVFYSSLTDETRGLFISDDYKRNLIYVDMPFVPVAETADSVDQVNDFTSRDYVGNINAGELTGVAATAIAVNELIVGSQWSSLGFAVVLTLMTLAIVFKDIRFSFWTTAPVIATVALQWLVMWQMDVSLSLVTVMIGSILVGVGVDFSIHIANRIRELGGGIEAIRTSTVSTGMSLFEAATVTTLGMITAYQIPIPEIKPFITVIIILLWIAAASALILLPAIFVFLEEMGIGSTGGANSMARKLGLGNVAARGDIDVVDAALIPDHGDAW